jgi:hypothetical protein
MIHNHWPSITRHDSQTPAQQPVVVNHSVLCCAIGCESGWVMLSQWLWIMVCYAERVVVNCVELCWASGCGCESCCAHHDSQPLYQHTTWWFTTTGSAYHTMIYNHWFSINHHDSQPLCYSEPVFVNDSELCWASGCESWCVMLSELLWIMVCYDEPVVVNCVELCWASGCGCESCCDMLSRVWLTTTYSA